MALVDVVITTYNRTPEVLGRALESVRGQTLRDIHIYVVDDNEPGSPARQMVRDYMEAACSEDSRIAYLENEGNSGACAARNNGFWAGSSPYVAFLDDDDEWLPEKLEKQLSRFKDSSIGLVSCGKTILFEESGKTEERLPVIQAPTLEDLLVVGNIPGSASMPLIRRTVLDDAGLFDSDMASAQDYDMWVRVSRIALLDAVTESLVIYHVYKGERISSNVERKYAGYKRLYEKNRDAIGSTPRAEAMFSRQLARYAAQMGDRGKAFKHLVRATRVQPMAVLSNLKCLAIVIVGRSRWL